MMGCEEKAKWVHWILGPKNRWKLLALDSYIGWFALLSSFFQLQLLAKGTQKWNKRRGSLPSACLPPTPTCSFTVPCTFCWNWDPMPTKFLSSSVHGHGQAYSDPSPCFLLGPWELIEPHLDTRYKWWWVAVDPNPISNVENQT